MTKLIIQERVTHASVVFDGMKRADVMQLFDAAEATHSNVYFESDYYGHDGGCDYYLRGDREETDEEYETRVEAEAVAAAKRARLIEKTEANERRELSRLKKKYEKK